MRVGPLYSNTISQNYRAGKYPRSIRVGEKEPDSNTLG